MTRATVAIVGAGQWASAHARVVVAHPDLRLAAIVEADEPSGSALVDTVVHLYEGERPRLFADLATAMADVDVDIVAIGDTRAFSIPATVLGPGVTVVGGDVDSFAGAGGWFPFDATSSTGRDGASDAAFAGHLRQYETVLASLGRGVTGAPA